MEASAAYLTALGIQCDKPETFDSEGTKEIYVGTYEKQEGLLLLVEAISEGPYNRAMKKRGPSLHHIAIDVLNVDELARDAQNLGWQLHPISETTIPKKKTAWLYAKGVPTLIEVHQQTLTPKPSKISRIELPMDPTRLKLFEGIGLGNIVTSSNSKLNVTIDGHRISFAELIRTSLQK